MIWLTSDTHFGHYNIIKYCNRPYSSVEAMNEGLVGNWNSVVQADDEVYFLGDLALNPKRAVSYVQRLNGKKYWIRGNHDKKCVKDTELTKHFEWIKDYHEIWINKVKVVLCHYPLATWNGCHRGSYMLHGHCHGSYKPGLPTTLDKGKVLDVGVDVHNWMPISTQQVEAIMAKKEFVAVDHHGADD